MTRLRDIISSDKHYALDYRAQDSNAHNNAYDLCWQLNQTNPRDTKKRRALLEQLFGDAGDELFVGANFQCDFGFNIHTTGLSLINSNVTILDTSPVRLGNGVFLAPGVVIACPQHALVMEQRLNGISHSQPITLEDGVWVGANVTIMGGVTIGKGSVIGAGSVVTKDIPAGVIALGSPCKVLRPIRESDRIDESFITDVTGMPL